jgi:hypothetical protein
VRKYFKTITGFCSIVFFFLFFLNQIHAKINVTIDRTYEVTEDRKMKVVEVQTIANRTENLYIPKDETVEFRILGFRSDDEKSKQIISNALQSVVVSENGQRKNYQVEETNDFAVLKFIYGANLLSGDTRSFRIEYIHEGLVYQNGALLDLYIHAFASNFTFASENTSYTYLTKLKVPKTIDKEINFVSPEPKISQDANFSIYQFDQNQLIDHYVWLQLGRLQIYDFKITQHINPTENFLTGLQNKFRLILPRDFLAGEVKQKVFFENISPEPKSVFQDDAGNIFAEFEFSSDHSSQIQINGYAKVERIDDIDFAQVVTNIDQIPQHKIAKYTHAAPFWEVNSEPIEQKAEELKGDLINTYDIALNVYEYIVNTIDYSDVKRFGINERQGALKTLQGGSAVCMEYSDLYLSLMRSIGIPSRAVFGYGYDPRYPSTDQESHQWVQIYMPGFDDWVDVDVTWGESGDYLVGGDLNHFYTHTAYIDPNTPAMISRYSYGNQAELSTPDFEIVTIETLPKQEQEYQSIQDLLEMYPELEESDLDFFIRQFQNRITAGFTSLKGGINLQNTSQILALGISLFAILIVLAVGRAFVKGFNKE